MIVCSACRNGIPQVWNQQQVLVAARRSKPLDSDIALLLEHAPVFTEGRRGGLENLTLSKSGPMLGVGETSVEISCTLRDIYDLELRILTLATLTDQVIS